MKHSPFEYEGSVEFNNDTISVLISRLGWLNYIEDNVVEITSKRYGEHNFLVVKDFFEEEYLLGRWKKENEHVYPLSSTMGILEYYKIIRHSIKESEGEVPISKIEGSPIQFKLLSDSEDLRASINKERPSYRPGFGFTPRKRLDVERISIRPHRVQMIHTRNRSSPVFICPESNDKKYFRFPSSHIKQFCSSMDELLPRYLLDTLYNRV